MEEIKGIAGGNDKPGGSREQEKNRKNSKGDTNPAGAGAGAGTGAETGKEEKFRELALVEQETPILQELEVPDVEEKKKSRRKKSKETSELKLAVSALLTGIFAIAESKDKTWKVDEAEIDLIADPAAKILSRNNKIIDGEKLDYLMLGIGIVAVCAPRIILTLQNLREKNANIKRESRKTNREDFAETEYPDFYPSGVKNVLQGIQ